MSAISTKRSNPGLHSNRSTKTNGRKSDGNHAAPAIAPKKLLAILRQVDQGDFSGRLPKELGLTGEVYKTLNSIIEKNEKLTRELGRISEVVGKEGKLSERAFLRDAAGGWDSCIWSVNTLIADLALPTAEVARVIGAVAQGDLSQNFDL
ncbi:MAG TPA: hypothetical protein VNA17_01575, partial [Pyrinomonadaceae bacterium]|nr:hypothetical protein [Pyrinomonadaceae bacterium]